MAGSLFTVFFLAFEFKNENSNRYDGDVNILSIDTLI